LKRKDYVSAVSNLRLCGASFNLPPESTITHHGRSGPLRLLEVGGCSSECFQTFVADDYKFGTDKMHEVCNHSDL
jgi:hypothetical protein